MAAYLVGPGTAMGVSAIIDADMQTSIDNYGYGNDVITSYWNIPGVGTDLLSAAGPDDSNGAAVRAMTTLDDGSYFVFGPVIGLSGFFTGTY